ncbi:hypothetical protein MATL_G00055980 [Megalops atlanticus]|uniref:Uncharacterized protein n=1 Tax=Megalops atlanticus TaxID=7932 RepID=A0A9D3QAL8_MEGAT|nr:hypothetical protein MATL_G00055980 [Megalops atlanticus]
MRRAVPPDCVCVFGCRWPLLNLDVVARQVGPGVEFLFFEHCFLSRGVILQCVTPVEPLLQCVSQTIFYQRLTPPLVPRLLLRAEGIQVPFCSSQRPQWPAVPGCAVHTTLRCETDTGSVSAAL